MKLTNNDYLCGESGICSDGFLVCLFVVGYEFVPEWRIWHDADG